MTGYSEREEFGIGLSVGMGQFSRKTHFAGPFRSFQFGNAEQNDSLQFHKDRGFRVRGEVFIDMMQRGAKGLNDFRWRALAHTNQIRLIGCKNLGRHQAFGEENLVTLRWPLQKAVTKLDGG